MTETKTFADLGVQPALCEALAEDGITIPFPIQELTLPLALAGADVIGQARTGTGKTIAFGIPLLQRATVGAGTQALVIVPTRELCFQVADDLTRAGAHKGTRVAAVYGGKAIDPQAEAIAGGAEIVVGTPGRLLDLMRRRQLNLSTVTELVLDEADEMLDLGFLPDVEQLIQATAGERQTMLFSATMPSAVVALARRYLHKPTFLRTDVEETHVAPKTRQFFFSCHRMDKPAVLARVLQTPERGLCLVFTRTKRMADILAEELRERGVPAAPIHSDLRQDARERALARFRQGRVDVLVATEVAARGLDIAEVSHVVNYDCPDDEKMYLHRIGRTGRAGAAGVAVTLAVWNELARLDMIRRALAISEPVHEVFSTSEILDELFDLPPRQQRLPASEAPSGSNAGRPEGSVPSGSADGAKPARRRTRTRNGAQGRREEPAVLIPAEASALPADSVQDQQDSSDEVLPRVRVRKRTVSSTRPQPTARRPAEPSPSEPRGRAAPRPVQNARRDSGRPPERDQTPARPRRRRGRRGNGREEEAASSARSGRRPSAAERGEQNRNGRGGQTRLARPAIAVADVEQARGGGRPRLRRALTIAHLP